MIGNRFQLDIATGRFTLPVVILLSLLLWGITSQTWAELGSFAIMVLTGYLMIEMNTAFSLIRTRTTFPVSIYWFLTTTLLFLHPFDWTHFIPLFFILSIYPMFHSYESHSASTSIFHSFLFIGLGSLVFPPFIYYIPLFLVSTISFRSLGIKSLLASLLGLATPYWFLFGHAFYHDQMYLFYKPFQEFFHFHSIDYHSIPPHILISWGAITILLLISSIHYVMVSYQDKTRTRINLSFIMVSAIWTTLFIALQPQHLNALFPIQLIGTAYLTAHLFTLTQNRFTNILFIVVFLVFIFLTGYNLWIQFFNF